MSTKPWLPSNIYVPGSTVVPRTKAASSLVALANGGFESGTTGWTMNGSASVTTWNPYAGTHALEIVGSSGTGGATSAKYDASPGMSITINAMYNQGRPKNGNTGYIGLVWYKAGGSIIRTDYGPPVLDTATDRYAPISASFTAPPETTHVAAILRSDRTDSRGSQFDNVGWSAAQGTAAPAGVMYRATQAKSGYSAATEPVWPGLGSTVVDNEVTWEGVAMSGIVWKAYPVLKSGSTEPTWPTELGSSIADNTISWLAYDPMIGDENCPQTKIAIVAKSKVYAGDGDMVRYSATLNPRDWSSPKDAGYISTGANQNGANKVAVLSLYRANLVPMNATTLQQWQIDPDPELMDLIDTMDGVGSKWHLAAVPVANDLFYLSNQGVRTVGMTGASDSLMSGDIGMPVDTIIKAMVAELESINTNNSNENLQPLGMYWPSMGQYWLAFNRTADSGTEHGDRAQDVCPSLSSGSDYCEVMVYTLSQVGQVGAWSRYIFPYKIDDWTQEGDDIYVRDGNTVYRIGYDVGTMDCIEGGGEN